MSYTVLARPLSLLALAAVGGALLAGCGNDVPPSAVATVGDSTISKAEFDRWLKNAAAGAAPGQKAVVPDPPDYEKCVAGLRKQSQGQGAAPAAAGLKDQCKEQYGQLRDQVMQFLIQAQWVQQEAEEQGVEVTDAEVRKTFDSQRKQAFPTDAAYKKFLDENGMTEEDILFRVKLDELQTKLTEKITKDKATPTDEEVDAFFAKNKQQFATPESRDVSLVLTRDRDRAEEAKAAIEGGESFASVAKEYSIDQATKAQGGKLTDLTRNQQDADLEKAAFAAPTGQLEGPVKAQFGYYVFEVTDVTAASQPDLEEVRGDIRQQLRARQEQTVLDDFIKDFRERYKEMTTCAEDYRIAECKNAPKGSDSTTPGAAPPGGAAPQGQAPAAPQGAAPVTPQGQAPAAPQGGVPVTPQGGGQGVPVTPGGGAAPQQQVPQVPQASP